jgi:hypothetical protein
MRLNEDKRIIGPFDEFWIRVQVERNSIPQESQIDRCTHANSYIVEATKRTSSILFPRSLLEPFQLIGDFVPRIDCRPTYPQTGIGRIGYSP